MIQIKTENNHFLIPIEEVKKKLIINEREFYLVPAAQLSDLLNQISSHKAEIEELKTCVISILRVLGLLDEQTQTIKAEIKSGEESYFPHILKALMKVVKLLAQAQVPVIGKSAEKELVETFAFIKTILPLIEKHGN